jgi:hypothetical protein
VPTITARTARRYVVNDVASFSSVSPSRMVTSRAGRPSRRGDRRRHVGIGWGDDGAEDEGSGPRKSRHDGMSDQGDGGGREEHEADREKQDGFGLPADVAQRVARRGPIEERRNEQHEHEVRIELDGGHERQDGQDETAHHLSDGERNVESPRERRDQRGAEEKTEDDLEVAHHPLAGTCTPCGRLRRLPCPVLLSRAESSPSLDAGEAPPAASVLSAVGTTKRKVVP